MASFLFGIFLLIVFLAAAGLTALVLFPVFFVIGLIKIRMRRRAARRLAESWGRL